MTNEPLSKKIKLSENNVEANKEREAETQAAIEKIDELQSELDALNDKASEEILQVIFLNYSSRLFFYNEYARYDTGVKLRTICGVTQT